MLLCLSAQLIALCKKPIACPALTVSAFCPI